MEDKPHLLIVGEQGVGKSTLIRRILSGLSCPVWGVISLKEDRLSDPRGRTPVYLHRAGEERRFSRDNLAAFVGGGGKEVFPEVFDRFARLLREPVPAGSVILLDELGFLESASPSFCDAVLNLLSGDIPVIAAVKPLDTPFLTAVREHPKTSVFRITEKNRDELPAVLKKIWPPLLPALKSGYGFSDGLSSEESGSRFSP